MKVVEKTPQDISAEGYRVLCDNLGMAGALRFLNQFSNGEGNYAEERDATCGGKSVEEIAELIRQKDPSRPH